MIRRYALLLVVLTACAEEDAQFTLMSPPQSDAGNAPDAGSKSDAAPLDAAAKVDASGLDARVTGDASAAREASSPSDTRDVGLRAQLVFANCTPGADQTCNDNPMHSSLHGHCEADRSCTCRSEFDKNPSTGLCL